VKHKQRSDSEVTQIGWNGRRFTVCMRTKPDDRKTEPNIARTEPDDGENWALTMKSREAASE
jgi:hypothetical protein